MKFIFRREYDHYIAAKIRTGKFETIRVYGLPDAYCGSPAVVIVGDIASEALTPDQAEQLAVGLVRAVSAARGQSSETDVLDEASNVVPLR